VIVIAGRNAQGKSSLLEALYVLATTRSPFSGSERETVHWEALEDVMPFSRVMGEVVRSDSSDTIEIVNVGQESADGDLRFSKRSRVNGAARRALDVLGTLNVVLFSPRDLDIVDGSPSVRRRFLDALLCQVDREYCRSLSQYNKVLTQRNHLLRQLRERGGGRGELDYWDVQLSRHGSLVMSRRMEAVRALSDLAAEAHGELAQSEPLLAVQYRPRLEVGAIEEARPVEKPGAADAVDMPGAADAMEMPGAMDAMEKPGAADVVEKPGAMEKTRPIEETRPIEDTPSLAEGFAAALMASLEAVRSQEIARGVTVSGPHRDDLSFLVGGVDMRTYGSRGQQRTVALALRLAEARIMRQATGERPVVMLDDVLSELDEERRGALLAGIEDSQQTLLTTTETDRLAPSFLSRSTVVLVEKATVELTASVPAVDTARIRTPGGRERGPRRGDVETPGARLA
jgi:DNA replication and repair protein RecF